jgi:hypothetical protein
VETKINIVSSMIGNLKRLHLYYMKLLCYNETIRGIYIGTNTRLIIN